MFEEYHEDGKGNVVVKKDGQWAISQDNGNTFLNAMGPEQLGANVIITSGTIQTGKINEANKRG